MNNYFAAIPLVAFIAFIYYGAIWIFSKKTAARLNKKRADLKVRAQTDPTARAEWEKSIKKREKTVKRCFSAMNYIFLFITAMLIIGSYFEIENLIHNYKVDGKILSLKNIKSFAIPMITIYSIYFLFKTFFTKSKKKDN